MLVDEDDYLAHIGTPRHSGRYPWGSGQKYTRSADFLSMVNEMKSQGLSDAEIARGLGITTTQLRARKTIAIDEARAANIAMAQRLKDKGLSNGAIAERMGLAGESSVRALIKQGEDDKANILKATSEMLQKQVDEKGYIQVGTGVDAQLGISKEKLGAALAVLKEQGYVVETVQVDQIGAPGNKTSIKVLAPPGTTYRDIASNTDDIKLIQDFSDDGGRSYLGVVEPLSVDSKRVAVRYADEGGSEADGVIYIRPGVDDVSLGSARYAQVRIAVDGTHYLKGMAMYKDDLPDGVDLLFNTNKKDTGNKLDAMKAMKDDPDNPFGAVIRQKIDPSTGKAISALNIVGSKEGMGEEGGWDTWSKSLSSQFLSKQTPALAKSQLDMTYENSRRDLDEILSLTNPAVKQKLLESYADAMDSSAVHLKAAALPRQSSHVILPVNSMKETEVYAPNFKNGERVVLVRYPHGGIFEIPELTVNNNHPDAKKLLGSAKDAVGIHSKVAERLSGADFDGDTVLVIPNNSGKIKTAPPLSGLKNFNPQTYKIPEGSSIKRISPKTKQTEMGKVSNLITDMTIRGATNDEIARAVRHSMVVIDAEKHNLNYKQSAIDNGIAALTKKYQAPYNSSGKPGASTLISRASSEQRVVKRKPRPASEGGPIDKVTGEKVYKTVGKTYVNKQGKLTVERQKSTKLAETNDAFTLSSGTAMESLYATHSNKLKALANEARKASVSTRPTPYSPSAKTAYQKEVASLDAKLKTAQKNSPLERQAQVIANATVRMKKQANPDMDSADLKKIKSQALAEARTRTGAQKQSVVITQPEWNAIQAGAVSHNKLKAILDNADLDVVKQLATPKKQTLMTSAKKNRAQAMLTSGYTQAEVASALGVSLTTLKNSLS